MGNLMTKMQNAYGFPNARGTRKRKRDRDNDDELDENEKDALLELSMNTPKKKKLLTTTQYIYQALFVDGMDADVRVMILDKIWNLHKIYLCQSPYFASMFGGAWRETEDNFVQIPILDTNINESALKIVFGSLYSEEVTIIPNNVTGVLAAATLFQLDELIEKCTEVMIDTINVKTVLTYYETAKEYGVCPLIKQTLNWLLTNFLAILPSYAEQMVTIDIDLMEELLKHPDLFVLQTEFSLYTTIKFWIYLKLHPLTVQQLEKGTVITDHFTYFSKLNKSTPFLLTENGEQYQRIFKRIRLQHLITHPTDFRRIIDDNILPMSWLNEPMMQHWDTVLRIDHNFDKGPNEKHKKYFYENCIRWGRMFSFTDVRKWRWTGFYYGLDLILTITGQILSIKRLHRLDNERLLSLQAKRPFLIKVKIIKVNEQHQIKHIQQTDIQLIELEKNQEVNLITIEDNLKYPLYVSINILVNLPNLYLRKDTAIISNIGSDDDNNNNNNNNKNNEISGSGGAGDNSNRGCGNGGGGGGGGGDGRENQLLNEINNSANCNNNHNNDNNYRFHFELIDA